MRISDTTCPNFNPAQVGLCGSDTHTGFNTKTMVDININDEQFAGSASASQEQKIFALEAKNNHLTNALNTLRSHYEQVLKDWVDSIDLQIDLYKRLTGREFESKHVAPSFDFEDLVRDSVSEISDYDIERCVNVVFETDSYSEDCITITKSVEVDDDAKDDLVRNICQIIIDKMEGGSNNG